MVEASANRISGSIPDSFKVHERLCIVIGNVDYSASRKETCESGIIEGSNLEDLTPE